MPHCHSMQWSGHPQLLGPNKYMKLLSGNYHKAYTMTLIIHFQEELKMHAAGSVFDGALCQLTSGCCKPVEWPSSLAM